MRRRDTLLALRMLPLAGCGGAATGNHGMGLFHRATGAQVYPALIKALVDAAN